MSFIERIREWARRVPWYGWVGAVGVAGVVVYFYWKNSQGSSTSTSGISEQDQGLALSNLAGMPFDYLNSGTTTDNTGYTDPGATPADTSASIPGVSGTVAAPTTASQPIQPTPAVVPTDTTAPAATDTSTPAPTPAAVNPNPAWAPQPVTPMVGESTQQAESREYAGCVANCEGPENHCSSKRGNAKAQCEQHCQEKCASRHPITGGGGFDDWSFVHNAWHSDLSQWALTLLDEANPTHLESDYGGSRSSLTYGGYGGGGQSDREGEGIGGERHGLV